MSIARNPNSDYAMWTDHGDKFQSSSSFGGTIKSIVGDHINEKVTLDDSGTLALHYGLNPDPTAALKQQYVYHLTGADGTDETFIVHANQKYANTSYAHAQETSGELDFTGLTAGCKYTLTETVEHQIGTVGQAHTPVWADGGHMDWTLCA